MNLAALNDAVDLSKTTGVCFIATANAHGLPHVSTAEPLITIDTVTIASRAWHCPGTLSNVSENRSCTVVVWDREQDRGYQLEGIMEGMEQDEVMDGYSPEIDNTKVLPQVQWTLRIKVNRIIDFSRAPHTDIEE